MNKLSNLEIQVIIKNIDDTPQGEVLKEYVMQNKDNSLYNLIRSHENIINVLPKMIFDMYEDVFLKSGKVFLNVSNVTNTDVAEYILDILHKYGENLSINLDMGKLFHSVKDPIRLYNRYPDKLPTTYVLNDSSTPLPEEFILENIQHFAIGIFENQFISMKVYKAMTALAANHQWVNSTIKSGIEWVMTHRKKAPALGEGVFELVYPMIDSVAALELFRLTNEEVTFVLNYEKNLKNAQRVNIIKHQPLTLEQMSELIADDEISLYLAHNKNVTDDMFENAFYNYKDIQWAYIARNICLTDYPRLTKLLVESGQDMLVKINVEMSMNNGNPVDIGYLTSLGVDLDFIDDEMLAKGTALESFIHN